ncbi:hypothetical protein RRG08_019818, partial [Elysia crispata]
DFSSGKGDKLKEMLASQIYMIDALSIK